jgi:hypothetical protein
MPRRALSALALLAAAAGIAACGESSDGGGGVAVLSPRALASVADKTTATGGLHMTLDQTMTIPGEGTIPTHAEGSFDTRARRGEITTTTDLSSVAGAGDLRAAASEQHVILDGLTFYMTSPVLAESFPAGKKWLKLDIGKLGKQAGIDFGALTQSGQDPTQALQYLRAASGDIVKVGAETVRGEPTTHYRATIDFDKVADAAPADQRAAIRRSIRQIVRLAGTSRAPMEVWIGEDGLARRLTDRITTKIAGRRSTITQRIELYDFGAKVDVQIPRASETLDAANLGAALAGALGTPG